MPRFCSFCAAAAVSNLCILSSHSQPRHISDDHIRFDFLHTSSWNDLSVPANTRLNANGFFLRRVLFPTIASGCRRMSFVSMAFQSFILIPQRRNAADTSASFSPSDRSLQRSCSLSISEQSHPTDCITERRHVTVFSSATVRQMPILYWKSVWINAAFQTLFKMVLLCWCIVTEFTFNPPCLTLNKFATNRPVQTSEYYSCTGSCLNSLNRIVDFHLRSQCIKVEFLARLHGYL
jgi:hypothetical protein